MNVLRETDDEKRFINILNHYTEAFSLAADSDEIGHVTDFLRNVFDKESFICLICLDLIENSDPIWNCIVCYTSFHISCIQKWAFGRSSDESSSSKPRENWNCPKCRSEYDRASCPVVYLCFCGNVSNPKQDLWLVPHSCGNICQKPLPGDCGHRCLLLCHPGPCPPCPKMVNQSCHCGKAKAVKRCSTRQWSCGSACGKRLQCSVHFCEKICHKGECPPCEQRVQRSCACGNLLKEVVCSETEWRCDKICGNLLNCGNHKCEIVCHKNCDYKCPYSGRRKCPCGKVDFDLPCTATVPLCGNLCQKIMSCGVHYCLRPCHYDLCGNCCQIQDVRCRCGSSTRKLRCGSQFMCGKKCNKLRNCGKHECKRRCCDGNCRHCDKICARPLNCGIHKCVAPCHAGRCFPCTEKAEISCACGFTRIYRPCGSRFKSPPECPMPCKLPSGCHHGKKQYHLCHFGSCPSCTLICGKLLPCQHKCEAQCHSSVVAPVVSDVHQSGPWKPVSEIRIKLTDLPCPPCPVLVTVACLGLHESSQLPCHSSAPYCCRRPCGRLLQCTRHTCTLECHEVIGSLSEKTAGTNCMQCNQPCTEPRPDGCIHSCSLTCHPGSCPPCNKRIKIPCHCGKQKIKLKCSLWCGAEPNKRFAMQSCLSPCTGSLPCGHPCPQLCHNGPCNSRCSQNSVIRCPCKKIKVALPCYLIDSFKIKCDDSCLKSKPAKKSIKLPDHDASVLNEEKYMCTPRVSRYSRNNVCSVVVFITLILILFYFLYRFFFNRYFHFFSFDTLFDLGQQI